MFIPEYESAENFEQEREEQGMAERKPKEKSTMDVRVRDTCGNCNGDGVIEHWAWKNWHAIEWRYRKRYPGHYPDQPRVEKWFRKRHIGFSIVLPPEEIMCRNCTGEGSVEYWMEISEFRKLIFQNEIRTAT